MPNKVPQEDKWALFVGIVEGGMLGEIGYTEFEHGPNILDQVIPNAWRGEYKTLLVPAPDWNGGPPNIILAYDPRAKGLSVCIQDTVIHEHFLVLGHDENGPRMLHCSGCAAHVLNHLKELVIAGKDAGFDGATHAAPHSVQ